MVIEYEYGIFYTNNQAYTTSITNFYTRAKSLLIIRNLKINVVRWIYLKR